MKTFRVMILFAALLMGANASAQEWGMVKGAHFLVFHAGDENFAKKILRHAEKYYKKIASDLGYARYDKFWQWDDRVKIYVYRTHEEFMTTTGKPEWVFGAAIYDEKTIISYRWSEGFTDSLLPHELAHLIFRDFVGFDGEVPLWMDEGVAQWEEEGRRAWALEVVEKLIEKESYIELTDLMAIGPGLEKDPELSLKFYAQAVTLVGFLIERYGGQEFTAFCRELRDGKTMNEALSRVYTTSISDTDELEKKWLEYYKKN